ncbi:MAG: hypothetical protein ACXVDK_06210 [Bacteroidia bacterium]
MHDFYVDGLSRNDIAIVPTAETTQAMKNAAMLFRNDDTGFRVLYRDYAGASFVDFKNVRLVFTMQLKNINEFLNFSNLNDGTNIYTSGKLLYFKNIGTETTNDLVYSLLDALRPSRFTYTFPQTAAAPGAVGTIEIRDENNVPVTPSYPNPNNVLADNSLSWNYPIDFSGLPKGLYSFKTTGNASTVTQKIYIDNNLSGQNVFGIVDILAKDYQANHFPPVPPPPPVFPPISDPRIYNARFVRRNTQWNYFLVLKSGTTVTGDTISIVDTATDPLLPYPSMSFVRQSDTEINGVTTAVFTGNQPSVPFYELAKKGLDIERNGNAIAEDIAGPALGVVSGTAAVTEIFVLI